MVTWLKNIADKRYERKRNKHLKQAMKVGSSDSINYTLVPTFFGDFKAGLRVLSGEFLNDYDILGGSFARIWDVHANAPSLIKSLHRFDWLDDITMVNTVEADDLILDWSQQWFNRFSSGESLGWEEEEVAWRLMRICGHLTRFLNLNQHQLHEVVINSICQHRAFLDLRFPHIKQYELKISMAAAIYVSSLLLEDEAKAQEYWETLETLIDVTISNSPIYLPSRDMSEASRILLMLLWLREIYSAQEKPCDPLVTDAIQIIGQNIRSLRFGNGSFLKVHGVDNISNDLIAKALGLAVLGPVEKPENPLGYETLRAGPLSIFMDAASPPDGIENMASRASTAALWVGDRKNIIIGDIGNTQNQPLSVRMSSQLTEASSTLVIENTSSSQIIPPSNDAWETQIAGSLSEVASISSAKSNTMGDSDEFELTHRGYLKKFGLLHERKLTLDRDGYFFAGIDILKPDVGQGDKIIQSVLDKKAEVGLPFAIWFHLDPSISPHFSEDRSNIYFETFSEMKWVFRQQGARMTIVDTARYIDLNKDKIYGKSILLESCLVETSGYVSWSFQLFPEKQ